MPTVPVTVAGPKQSPAPPQPPSTSADLHADVSFPAPLDAGGDAAGLLAGSPDDSSVVLGFIDDHSGPEAFQETLKLLDLNSRALTNLFTIPRGFTAASVAINAKFMVWSQAHVQLEQQGSTLMVWDRVTHAPPVEIARDPNGAGPSALAFVMHGSQVVYRMSAGEAQTSDSLVWADLATGRIRTIYTAPPQTTVRPEAIDDNSIVWIEATRGLAADGSPKMETKRLRYMKLNEDNPAEPQTIAIPVTNDYYGAVLDAGELYFQRDDGVVRIDAWQTQPIIHQIWERSPGAGSFLVGSDAMLGWTDSTDGRVMVYDTTGRSILVDPAAATVGLVAAKGVLVWETNSHLADPSSTGPVTLNLFNVLRRKAGTQGQ